MRSGPGEARTILLLHIISVRPFKQPLMARTFLKVYMELGSYILFLREQIKDIIIIDSILAHFPVDTNLDGELGQYPVDTDDAPDWMLDTDPWQRLLRRRDVRLRQYFSTGACTAHESALGRFRLLAL